MGDDIVIRPIAIAARWTRPTPKLDTHPVDNYRLWHTQIDQFAGVDWGLRLREKDLDILRAIPEVAVKAKFAEILGEPEVPKDWGGEQFDLFTTLFVDARPLSAAIAFKGPAKFHPMEIRDLGKNADQVDRLASTPADVLVVQHCHAIHVPVINMLRAYAANATHPRRYMTLDGYNTLRIFRHLGFPDQAAS